ncbi:hypothetical protein BDR22DRAFT_811162 [Usnea florida]
MSVPPPPPPGLDIYASRQPSVYAATIITCILAIVAIGLRIWCRKLTKSGYDWDDWLVIVAGVVALGQTVSTIIWVRRGFGLHLWVLGPGYLTEFFKSLFAGEIMYFVILCLVKYSILAFYRRMFARNVRMPVYILAGFVTAWGISMILVTIFQCDPVSGFWNRGEPAHCAVSDYAFFIGNAVPNIITDVAILSLPLPFIFRLHRTQAQKIALAGIFLLGSFIIIISIVRLVALVQVDLTSPDLDWNFVFVGIWSAIEYNMAIVCACLPSLRPILSLVTDWSPFRNHCYNNQSDNRYISSLFAKRSRDSASRRSHRKPTDQSESQRGFVSLSDGGTLSRAFAGKADSPERERGFGEDIEMQ